MRITSRPVTVKTDGRGVVFEPIEAADFAALKNAHVVISNPGAVRGNHYHLKGREIITVMGPALVRFQDGRRVGEVSVPEGTVFRFDFPPGTAHALKNTGSRPNLLVAFNTVPHDPEHPDTVPEILIPWE